MGKENYIHKNETQDGGPLAYRLRNTVRYHKKNRSLYLILDYPLKAICLNPVWAPVIRLLDTDEFTSFEDIAPRMGHAGTERIEAFLNELTRKGFLESKGISTPAEYPPVSIIIPVRNRPEDLMACLQSLETLDYPKEMLEVIVVDDASHDHTPDVAAAFPVHLIRLKEHRQASFCRNLAARKAKGEILAFLDSDCRAHPLWLKELTPGFNDPQNGAVGGMVDSYLDHKGLDRYEKVKSSLNMGSWPRNSREGDRFFYLPACNLLVRKALFLQLGGFREHMSVGEDVDLCWRLQDQGHHLEYRPMGRIYHRHRNKIGHFCARRFDYGTSEPLLQKYHVKRNKQFIFSLSDALFWGLALLTVSLMWMPLLGSCGIILLTDSLIKFVRIRKINIPIRYHRLVLATFRGYLAFLYHCCAFVSRYYLFWVLPFFLFMPLLSVTVFGMHLLTGIGEYFIKRPRLNPALFLLYFTLDQVSYQLGVWWGCLKGSFFGPVNPRIVKRSFLKVVG
jgi:mycofactocin system glycosyltransferase